MPEVSLSSKSSPQSTPIWRDSPASRLHKPLFILFLLWCTALIVTLLLKVPVQEPLEWTEGVLYLLAAVSCLIALNRRLPLQSVLAAAAIIGVLSTAIEIFSLRTGIPFGSRRFTEHLGDRWFGILPWPLPLLWITVIISSRGIARLVMR